MKNKASVFVKKITSMLTSIAKGKSMAIKNKTPSFKTRFVMFSLMKSKKVLLGSISDKIRSILYRQNDDDEDEAEDQSRAVVLYNTAARANESSSSSLANGYEENEEEEDDDDKYPDLTHSLFDDEEEFNDPGGSIIDLVKNSKENGEDFSLEDEIDHVADLFIMRFR